MAGKGVLGYWDIRGFAQPSRLLLHYLGVDYHDKRYVHGPAPDFSMDMWFKDKFSLGLPFPNLPYWIDDKVKLVESRAILKYLAHTYGPELVPSSVAEQGTCDMLEGYVNDLQQDLLTLSYSKTPPQVPLQVSMAKRFEQLEDFIGVHKWVLGDKLCYVDFFVYEVLIEFQKYDGDFFKGYSKLGEYIENFLSIPSVSQYEKNSQRLLCYSPAATVKF